MISFRCPCGKLLSVGNEGAGKRVRCPGCARLIVAPARSGQALPPAESLRPPLAEIEQVAPASPQAPAPAAGASVPFRDLGYEELAVQEEALAAWPPPGAPSAEPAPPARRPEAEGPPHLALRACPACKAPLSPSAVLCARCGLDLRSGQRAAPLQLADEGTPLTAGGAGGATETREVTGGQGWTPRVEELVPPPPLAPHPSAPGVVACPECRAPMSPRSALCPACGFNLRTGQRPAPVRAALPGELARPAAEPWGPAAPSGLEPQVWRPSPPAGSPIAAGLWVAGLLVVGALVAAVVVFARGGRDAFVGTWIEYWPGVRDHDINTVTYGNGRYSVRVENPITGPYPISNIRREGDVLKFTEHPGMNTIHYEVRVLDRDTCAVQVHGGPLAGPGVIWKRKK